jgi:hypothetical protein
MFNTSIIIIYAHPPQDASVYTVSYGAQYIRSGPTQVRAPTPRRAEQHSRSQLWGMCASVPTPCRPCRCERVPAANPPMSGALRLWPLCVHGLCCSTAPSGINRHRVPFRVSFGACPTSSRPRARPGPARLISTRAWLDCAPDFAVKSTPSAKTHHSRGPSARAGGL